VKPNINAVEVHLQPSNNGHPVDGGVVGAWFTDGTWTLKICFWKGGRGQPRGGGEGCTRPSGTFLIQQT